MTAYQSLRALGVSEDASAPFHSLDQAPTASRSGGGIRPMNTPGPAKIYDSSCIDWAGDSGNLHVHDCDVQYKIWQDPANSMNWWMEDDSEASGTMHDTALFNPDEITGLLFGYDYSENNVISKWDPTQMVPRGQCTTETTSVSKTLDGTTWTVSNSTKSCPEQEGLYELSNTRFTTKWDGEGNGPSDGSRSTVSVAAVHSPSNAPGAVRWLRWHVWWT
jgi:hypothetical protein